MTFREFAAAALHRFAHRIDPYLCQCAIRAYMAGWKQRRDAELREAELRGSGLPTNPDEMDAWFRRVIADNERPAA